MKGPQTKIPQDRLRAYTQELCDIGNRFVGSPGEQSARQFIQEAMADAGLDRVRAEPFRVVAYAGNGASCEEIGVLKHPIPCVGLQYSSSGEAIGVAVSLGRPDSLEGLQQAFDRQSLEGCIAVLESPYPYLFSEFLASCGVAGVVVISDALGGWVSHLNALMYPALARDEGSTVLPYPGVTVEREAGKELQHRITRERVSLRLSHEASYSPLSTANIIGEISGDDSDETLVIGAHYDTQLEGMGASDNATGIASLIMIAERLAADPPPRTVRFVAFGDEEGGLQGSVSYCRSHSDSLERTITMINLDALGWYPAGRSLHADASIVGFARSSAVEAGWPPDNEEDASAFPGSDHNPFIDAGVPSCFFWRNPPTHPYYHTAGDTPDLLNFEIVAETASVAEHVLNRVARDRGLSFGRSRPTHRWLDLHRMTSLQEADERGEGDER